MHLKTSFNVFPHPIINGNSNIVIICASNHFMQIMLSFLYTEQFQTLCQPVAAKAEI